MAPGNNVAASFRLATTLAMLLTKLAVAWNASGLLCARGVETRVSKAKSSSPLSMRAHSNTFRSSAALYTSSTCAEHLSDGHESRQWREGASTRRGAAVAPPSRRPRPRPRRPLLHFSPHLVMKHISFLSKLTCSACRTVARHTLELPRATPRAPTPRPAAQIVHPLYKKRSGTKLYSSHRPTDSWPTLSVSSVYRRPGLGDARRDAPGAVEAGRVPGHRGLRPRHL